MDNGCEQGPLSDIAHTIGGSLQLTHFSLYGISNDTANNLIQDVQN